MHTYIYVVIICIYSYFRVTKKFHKLRWYLCLCYKMRKKCGRMYRLLYCVCAHVCVFMHMCVCVCV